MREPTVARNYAETLVVLAQRAEDVDGWGRKMDEVAEACASDERLRRFLETPRVTVAEKSRIVGQAFAKRLPPTLVRFLQAVILHRRQHLLTEIAIEYHAMVDALSNRVHAQVQVARKPTAERRAAIARQLTRITGLSVVPHFVVSPRILGGVVVKVGDTVMDGSVARRLASLRNRMLGTPAR